jgi:Icc-related predicted phosphoesterase
MRIAYLVDVHDRFDAVSEAMTEVGPVDVLIVGGDITTQALPRMPRARSSIGARSHRGCSRSPGP